MKLVLGTAQFGQKYGITNNHKIKFDEIKKIEKKLLQQKKIDFLDTAFDYGETHKIISKTDLSKLKIITKIKLPKHNKNIEKFINLKVTNLIKSLGSNKLFGLLIHNFDDYKKNNKSLIELLQNLKKKKIVRYLGISVYNVSDLDKILKFWTPDIVQIPLNVLDQRFLKNNYLKKLKKKKIKVFARSCFLQGVLINDNINFKIDQKNLKILEDFKFWCRENNISSIEACINFIKQQKHIDFLIVGINSVNHLLEINKYFFKKKTINVPKKFEITNLKLIDPRKWKYDL